MRKRHLEIILEKVKTIESPNPYKEQYSSPAVVASELLYFAYMRHDLENIVYDLGSGTGILSIGAKLLGAKKVVGFDNDIKVLKTARENSKNFGIDIEFVCTDIKKVCGYANTVVMNPPFGAQIKGNDRPFLKKALEVSDVIYSLHNSGSSKFIKKFITPSVITDCKIIDFPIKRLFHFHKKEVHTISIEMYRIEKRDYH